MKLAKVLPRRSRQDFINRKWGGTPTFDFSFDWYRTYFDVTSEKKPGVKSAAPVNPRSLLEQWDEVTSRMFGVASHVCARRAKRRAQSCSRPGTRMLRGLEASIQQSRVNRREACDPLIWSFKQ